jgi:hypothetical protein
VNYGQSLPLVLWRGSRGSSLPYKWELTVPNQNKMRSLEEIGARPNLPIYSSDLDLFEVQRPLHKLV